VRNPPAQSTAGSSLSVLISIDFGHFRGAGNRCTVLSLAETGVSRIAARQNGVKTRNG